MATTTDTRTDVRSPVVALCLALAFVAAIAFGYTLATLSDDDPGSVPTEQGPGLLHMREGITRSEVEFYLGDPIHVGEPESGLGANAADEIEVTWDEGSITFDAATGGAVYWGLVGERIG